MNRPVSAFLVLGAGLFLTGCSSDTLPRCPAASILADTMRVTGFRPGAPAELSGEAFTATMTEVKSDCSFDRTEGRTDSSLTITVRATRAPSADAAVFTVPYYVAVSQGERVISKKTLNLQIDFAPGSAVSSQTLSQDDIVLELETGHPPTDYQLLAGFQLTDAQRAYNTRRARYLP